MGFIGRSYTGGRGYNLRQFYSVEEQFSGNMFSADNRKYPRLQQSFEVQIHKHGQDLTLDGTSINISQGGALIKTRNWRSFQVDDRAVLAFHLPPRFTGQERTIGLQGRAIISRIDVENQGIGVEFVRSFRFFDLIEVPNLAGDRLM